MEFEWLGLNNLGRLLLLLLPAFVVVAADDCDCDVRATDSVAAALAVNSCLAVHYH